MLFWKEGDQMYIHPILVGVIGTVLVELAALIVYAIITSMR